jgi:hypothetical protein
MKYYVHCVKTKISFRPVTNNDKNIEKRIASIDMNDVDKAMVGDKERARQILTWLKVDEPSIVLLKFIGMLIPKAFILLNLESGVITSGTVIL